MTMRLQISYFVLKPCVSQSNSLNLITNAVKHSAGIRKNSKYGCRDDSFESKFLRICMFHIQKMSVLFIWFRFKIIFTKKNVKIKLQTTFWMSGAKNLHKHIHQIGVQRWEWKMYDFLRWKHKINRKQHTDGLIVIDVFIYWIFSSLSILSLLNFFPLNIIFSLF